MAVKHLGNQVYTGLTADTKPTTAPSGSIFINTQTAELSIYDGADWDLINLSTATVADDSITNAKINSAAAIAYSKLNLGTSIVNADIAAGAAIVKSKLASLAIVNTDIDAAAAIAYSKLALTGAILNADLAGSIAYSKLSLTGAILNADLAGSIAYSKLSLTGAILNADIAAGAAIAKSKLASLAIVNADVDAAAAIAKSKLAALDIVNADVNASAAIATTKLEQKRGASTQSGDGTTVAFNIAHGFGSSPTFVSAEPGSDDARGQFTSTKDSTNIILTYAVAPPSGSSNLTWYWSAS
jgi:hypothetical protein